MTTLVWQRTTYSDAHQEYPAVYVRWGDVTAYLGCPHEGDPVQDARLVQGLLESGAPAWVQDAPGWLDEHGWGLYRAGRPCLTYQVLEDNGGGLHLAVFDSNDKCIWYASGYEHNPSGLREDIAALKEGSHPVADEWEPNLPDGYTPQQLYDDLTSREYSWEIIADDVGVYPERMGAAGCVTFGLDDTISYEVDLLELTKQESGIIIYGDEVIVCNWASFKGLPKVFTAGLIDWPARIPMVAGVRVDDLSPLLRSKKIIYNANDDELPQSGTVYRIQEDIIVIGPDGWG